MMALDETRTAAREIATADETMVTCKIPGAPRREGVNRPVKT
jgi:hypothetical protein